MTVEPATREPSTSLFTLPDGQNVLGLILVLTAILSAGGYVVTQAHINRYTDITTYSVMPAQFLAAGLNLIMSTVVVMFFAYSVGMIFDTKVSKTRLGKRAIKFIHSNPLFFYRTDTVFSPGYIAKLPYFGSIIILIVSLPVSILLLLLNVYFELPLISISFFMAMTSSLFLLPIGFFNIFTEKRSSQVEIAARNLMFKQQEKIFYNIIRGFLFSFLLLIYIMGLGYIYGSFIYSLIPRVIGGGRPITVSIAFRDEKTGKLFGLLTNEQGQVENVCLLAELIDGILIYDPAQKRTIAVQTGAESDVIGYYDNNSSLNCNPPLRRQSSPLPVNESNLPVEPTAEVTPEVTQEATAESTHETKRTICMRNYPNPRLCVKSLEE